MNIKVYVKDGVTINTGQGFVFTGVGAGSAWEVDLALAGSRVHGIAPQDLTSRFLYDAYYIGVGPAVVSVSTAIAVGDEITPDGTGNFKKRTDSDFSNGMALSASSAGGQALVLLYHRDAPARAASTATTVTPTKTTKTIDVLEEMSVSLTTLACSLHIGFSGNFFLRDGDSFHAALFLDGTELPGTRRTVGYTAASGAGVTPGQIDGEVVHISTVATGVSAGSHTIELRWAQVSGVARAVGLQRKLHAIEIR